MSRHPELNDALHELLFHARAPLIDRALDALLLVLLHPTTGAALEQYEFGLELAAEHDVPATYSDVETMFAGALTRLAGLDVTLTPLPKDTTFTVLMRAHEALAGPAPHAGDGGPAGGVMGAPQAAAAAAAGTSTTTSSSNNGRGAGTVSGTGSAVGDTFWARVDPGDPEAGLASAAGAPPAAATGLPFRLTQAGGGGPAPNLAHLTYTAPIKTIRAGSMAVDVSVARGPRV
jgi:hypothetical protein